MLLRIVILIAVTNLTACTATKSTDERQSATPNKHVQTIRDYTLAFNNRDLETMLSLVSDDIQWLSIDGDQISEVTSGKTALSVELVSYFKQCETCRSRLENISATKNRVSATEIASWEANGQTRSQGALSVYEMKENRIVRVYYFAAE